VSVNDAVERVVRDLIKENMLSRARAVLSLFQDDYPHLLLELEAASGNWKTVLKVYENLSEERKDEYNTLYKTAHERVKTDYSQDVKEAFEEANKNNFEGAMAILESVSKTYPELVEAVALKLELARRKGDKARAKIFENVLKKLDASHPLLIAKSGGASNFVKMDLIVLIAILFTLAISLAGIFQNMAQSSKIDVVESEMQELRTHVKELDLSLRRINESFSNFEISTLSEKVEQASNELSQSVDKILLAIESIKEGESQELGSLKEEIIKLLGEARSKPISLELSENLSIDLVRSLWLFGYQLYRSGYYQDAYNVLENVSNILKDTSIYFKDDAFYFMALSSYEVGNIVMASQLFSKFITLYPDSEYVPHAKYFLERMSGAGK